MVDCVIFSVELHKTKCALPSTINTSCAAIKYFIAGRSLRSSHVRQGGTADRVTS